MLLVLMECLLVEWFLLFFEVCIMFASDVCFTKLSQKIKRNCNSNLHRMEKGSKLYTLLQLPFVTTLAYEEGHLSKNIILTN